MRLFIQFLKRERFDDPSSQINGDLLPAAVSLARQYGCDSVVLYIKTLLLSSSDFVRPWPLFVTASKLDSVEIARSAIGRFTLTDYDWTGTGADGGKLYLARLNARYVIGLSRAVAVAWSQVHTVTVEYTYPMPLNVPTKYGSTIEYYTPPPLKFNSKVQITITASDIAKAFAVPQAAPAVAKDEEDGSGVAVWPVLKLVPLDGEAVEVPVYHLQASR